MQIEIVLYEVRENFPTIVDVTVDCKFRYSNKPS